MVPETTVLSVELQARFSARHTVFRRETYRARGIVAAATGGEESRLNPPGIKIRLSGLAPSGATLCQLVIPVPGRAVGSKGGGALALADSGGLARGLVEMFLEPEPLFTLGRCDRRTGPVLQDPEGVGIVTKRCLQDPDESLLAGWVFHRDKQFHPLLQIARHPVRRGKVDFGIASMMEVEDTGVFEIAVYD